MEDQIRNHAIWSVLEQLAALKGDPVIVEASSDLQAFWSTQRVFQFASIVEHRLRQGPSTILAVPVLNQLNSVLTTALNEARSYVSNKNVGHLANAVNQIESAGLQYLAQVPLVSSSDAIGKITDEFTSQTQGVLKAVINERTRLQKEVEALVGQAGKLGEQVQSLSEAVAKQQAEAMNVVKAVETAYAAKELDFKKQFDAATTAHNKAHEDLKKTLTEEMKVDRDAAKSEQGEVMIEMRGHLAHARKLLGVIGNVGVTGNYLETATKEASSANVWRWITLGAFIAAAAVGALTLWLAQTADFKLTAARMAFAILILGVTVYTSRESARHRTNADRAKRVELELASLGPFVESLDKSKQDLLREKLTSEYFGKELEPHKVAPTIEPKDLVVLLKAAIDRLGK